MSKILVVNEDAKFRSFCYEVLKGGNHEVTTLPLGDEAVSVIQGQTPDLMLIDLRIYCGKDSSIANQAKESKTAVVVVAENVNPALERSASAAGAVAVIEKKISEAGLSEQVKKIVSAHQKRIEIEKGLRKDKVLIVDDEKNIRDFLSVFLNRKGFVTVTAGNGEEAVELVKTEKPAMILLDVNMPGMDGILTLQKIREFDSQVGVVMATGVEDEKVAKAAMDSGAYAYVLKPFDMQYLEMVVLTRMLMSA